MKTIEQLLQLSSNPYYQFSVEEQKLLDDFLASNKGKQSKNSEKNSRATVVKNIPQKNTGVLPTAEMTAEATNLADLPVGQNVNGRAEETKAVEDQVHPDAVK